MIRWLAFASLVLAACTPEVSQVMLEIQADPLVAAEAQSLEIEIGGGETASRFVQAAILTEENVRFPVVIPLAPKDENPSRFFRVVARARRAQMGTEVPPVFVQAAIIGTYVRGRTETVVLRLEASCIDLAVPCGEYDHCTGANCVDPPVVDPNERDGSVSDMSMPDSGPSDMGPTRCATDGDCDDGISCTLDTCTTGRCQNMPVDSVCPAAAGECQRAVCDPAIGCTDVPEPGPCDDGMFCNGTDSCVDGVCVPSGDSPCVGMSECQEDTDECTGCGTDSDCSNGRFCNGGGTCQCPMATEQCTATGDEDCDGLVNCMDPDCAGQGCGAGPDFVCMGGMCRCPGAAEICGQPGDENCNGLANCDDPACPDGTSCGAGRMCMGGACVDDSFEVDCDNSFDDDGDGDQDCLDDDCEGLACRTDGGAPGMCVLTICEAMDMCVPVAENTALRCDDGIDNDCDGFSDCDDSNCTGICCDMGIGPGCDDGGMCGPPGSEDTSTECDDGTDNDCDGDSDCADSDCFGVPPCAGDDGGVIGLDGFDSPPMP